MYGNKVIGAGVLPCAEHKLICAVVASNYRWNRCTVHLTYLH